MTLHTHVFLFENDGEVLKQGWSLHVHYQHIFNAEKDKLHDYKEMIESQLVNGRSTKEQRFLLKVKPRFIHGSFCDAVKNEGLSFTKGYINNCCIFSTGMEAERKWKCIGKIKDRWLNGRKCEQQKGQSNWSGWWVTSFRFNMVGDCISAWWWGIWWNGRQNK